MCNYHTVRMTGILLSASVITMQSVGRFPASVITIQSVRRFAVSLIVTVRMMGVLLI